jgi:ABC-type antimicrobial peptide transport system permease subunit
LILVYDISDDLKGKIELALAYTNAEDALDMDDFKAYVIDEIENETWTGDDQLIAFIFVDVFIHSYDYWTENGNNNKVDLNHNQQIILADAIGALHGSIFGAFGSIIEGAVWSIIVAE